MFERGKAEPFQRGQQAAVPVEITLDGGATAKGKLFISAARGLGETLNTDIAFLEFQPYGGERTYIAKSTLKSVRPVHVPAAANPQSRLKEIDQFDPYAVLGVKAGAAWEDIRAAYVRLSKSYHPDRYASVELPVEVLDYMLAMARRVNAAYAALEAPRKAANRPAAATRAEAAYAATPRN
jgi:hypothetical protein